jgi:hypothetical protein
VSVLHGSVTTADHCFKESAALHLVCLLCLGAGVVCPWLWFAMRLYLLVLHLVKTGQTFNVLHVLHSGNLLPEYRVPLMHCC